MRSTRLLFFSPDEEARDARCRDAMNADAAPLCPYLRPRYAPSADTPTRHAAHEFADVLEPDHDHRQAEHSRSTIECRCRRPTRKRRDHGPRAMMNIAFIEMPAPIASAAFPTTHAPERFLKTCLHAYAKRPAARSSASQPPRALMSAMRADAACFTMLRGVDALTRRRQKTRKFFTPTVCHYTCRDATHATSQLSPHMSPSRRLRECFPC